MDGSEEREVNCIHCCRDGQLLLLLLLWAKKGEALFSRGVLPEVEGAHSALPTLHASLRNSIWGGIPISFNIF